MSDAHKNPDRTLIVLVTGARSGIGLEAARALGARGATVYLTARQQSLAEQAMTGLPGDLRALALDVDDPASISAAAEKVAADCPRLDVLINNAGLLPAEDASVLETTRADLLAAFATNTAGPLLVTQAFRELLEKSSTPRVINVSSGAGQLNDGLQDWAPAYSISKTALNALTQHFASELPRFAVNAVSPGWVRTAMGGNAAPLSVAQGADTILWLALEAPQNLTGKFLRDRTVIDW